MGLSREQWIEWGKEPAVKTRTKTLREMCKYVPELKGFIPDMVGRTPTLSLPNNEDLEFEYTSEMKRFLTYFAVLTKSTTPPQAIKFPKSKGGEDLKKKNEDLEQVNASLTREIKALKSEALAAAQLLMDVFKEGGKS